MRPASWFHGLSRPRRAPRPRALSKLTLEKLEDRLCPSYTITDLGALGGSFGQGLGTILNDD